jgi:hypothetical protein
MPSKEESNRLLVRLTRIASEVNDAERDETRSNERYLQLLNHIDVTPYKKTAAWPGKSYLLVGNSFNMDVSLQEPVDKTRRAACIAVLISRGAGRRNCVSIAEALADEGFTSNLSRFEKQWLTRLPETSLIGPAYDDKGNLIAQAFAVWRKEFANQRENEKQLVGAGKRR